VKLNEIAKEHSDDFEVVIVQAAKVLERDAVFLDGLLGLNRLTIRVNELGAAMVDTALHGSGSRNVTNVELRRRGKALVKR
jgi:hypothetical protein